MASTNHPVIITDTYQIKYLAIPLAPRLIQFTPWELALLNAQYIQKGLLFAKPPHLSIRNKEHEWMADPIILRLSSFNQNAVYIGSGPRFEMYECDFGWGKPVSTGSGAANKVDGKFSLYPGWEGKGSMDLEVCLFPDTMAELLKDHEFMIAVSEPVDLKVRLDVCLTK